MGLNQKIQNSWDKIKKKTIKLRGDHGIYIKLKGKKYNFDQKIGCVIRHPSLSFFFFYVRVSYISICLLTKKNKTARERKRKKQTEREGRTEREKDGKRRIKKTKRKSKIER